MNEKPYNPWREFIENVIKGDNFFRTQEYYDLLDDIDARIAKEAEQDARIAELTAEVARLREALNAIDVIACIDRSHPVISTLARNVLREGE